MNNFNPYLNMFCQIWVVPNMVGNGAQFYAPIAMYPQFAQPQLPNPIGNLPEVNSTANLPEIKPKTEEIA